MARRGAGEGSIYREGNGWRASVVVGWTVEGKPRRKSVRGPTRKSVVEKVGQLLTARDQGFLSTGKVPTVGEWLEHWLTVIAPDRIRPSTAAGYEGYLRRYLVPLLGRHRLDRLRAEHIERAWADLAARGLSPATVRQAHRILSRALTVAVRRGRIAVNPASLLDGPSVVRDEVASFTPAQARQLMAAAAGSRMASRWTAGLAIGLRQGEVLGLRWDDVDLDAGTLTVRRALQRQKGEGLVVVEPKSRRSRRTVLMPGELVVQLRARRSEQLQERLVAGSVWVGAGERGDLVWTQPNGRPIDPRRDWAAWRELCAAAGVPALRLHDARHTAASLLLVQGVHPRVVMEILGHSSSQLTLDTYSHVAPELAEHAAAAMSSALWGW